MATKCVSASETAEWRGRGCLRCREILTANAWSLSFQDGAVSRRYTPPGRTVLLKQRSGPLLPQSLLALWNMCRVNGRTGFTLGMVGVFSVTQNHRANVKQFPIIIRSMAAV